MIQGVWTLACAIAAEGRVVESATVRSSSPSFDLKKRNRDISLTLPLVHHSVQNFH